MTDTRRRGDTRPYRNNVNTRLTWVPVHDEPLRWLPRHGDPFCILEWISQKIIKTTALLPVYIAIVVTLTLLVLVKGYR